MVLSWISPRIASNKGTALGAASVVTIKGGARRFTQSTAASRRVKGKGRMRGEDGKESSGLNISLLNYAHVVVEK